MFGRIFGRFRRIFAWRGYAVVRTDFWMAGLCGGSDGFFVGSAGFLEGGAMGVWMSEFGVLEQSSYRIVGIGHGQHVGLSHLCLS